MLHAVATCYNASLICVDLLLRKLTLTPKLNKIINIDPFQQCQILDLEVKLFYYIYLNVFNIHPQYVYSSLILICSAII